MSDTLLQIEDPRQLDAFCQRCSDSPIVAFDTEFVSENRYRPELCLLQVATESEIAIIDTLKIKDINPFWRMLTGGSHLTIAHAAREEFLFCHRACQQKPKKLLDVQLAAAFVGFDYPVSYSNLVTRITGQLVPKGETRTDWKKRPLSDRQITYAAGDVEHLALVARSILEMLNATGRTDWYYEEIESWMNEMVCCESEPQWHRVSGASRLSRRALGILRELWITRDEQAERRNRSPKRVIPDDLLIELAKRGSAVPSNFKSIRGFEGRVHRDLSDAISDAINRGNEVPEAKLPSKLDRGKSINTGLLGQFLATVLGVVCREQNIAPGLVGTTQDLRNLAAWRLGLVPNSKPPSLTTGWRAEIIGAEIERAMDGQIGLRIENPSAEQPLAIVKL